MTGSMGGSAMPVHDWPRIYAGPVHDFHHEWLSTVKRALNHGLLPSDDYAMVDQVAGGLGPDVLALERPSDPRSANGNGSTPPAHPGGRLALAERPPRTRFHITDEPRWYAAKNKAIS